MTRRTFAAAAVLAAALAGCAEQQQSITVPSPEPAGYDHAFLEEVLDIVAGNGVRNGQRPAVVVAMIPEAGRVLVVTGPEGEFAYLSLCADDYGDWAQLNALLDRGDLIDYEVAGDDDAVCLDEIRLSYKGAAAPATATPTPR